MTTFEIKLDCEQRHGKWLVYDQVHGHVLSEAETPEKAWAFAAEFLAARMSEVRRSVANLHEVCGQSKERNP